MRNLLLVLLLASCGGPSAEPPSAPPAPAPPTPAPAADPDPPPALALHEWGLVDVDLAAGTAELSTGPGTPARPVLARKPVLYAHLVDGDAASLDLRVRLPAAGRFLEVWPGTPPAANELAWHLEVRRGACAAPSRDIARACDAPDGFCEVAELPRYVTSDSDCIDVGGERASLLFYRASIPMDALPLRIERGPDLGVRATRAVAAPGGPTTILRISSALSGPWPPGRLAVSRATLPAEGTVTVPVGQTALDPAAERSAMQETLTGELGLTADEARVFLEAWSEELFGPGAARETQRRRPAPRAQDVILYWLAPTEVARLSTLEASVPIATHRAFLVRVTLPAVATAGPAAP